MGNPTDNMPPTLHIVRHAEGFHNSSKGGEGIHDPLLTEKGQEQCRKLCKDFPHHDKSSSAVSASSSCLSHRNRPMSLWILDPPMKRSQRNLAISWTSTGSRTSHIGTAMSANSTLHPRHASSE